MEQAGHVVNTGALLADGFLVFRSDPSRVGLHDEPAVVRQALGGARSSEVVSASDVDAAGLVGTATHQHGKVLVVTSPVEVPIGDTMLQIAVQLDLARNLSLQVVAEGVETVAVWDDLAELGRHLLQGYYLSRALPAEAIPGWLAESGTIPA